VRLSPATADLKQLARWQAELKGRGIDGVMAKRLEARYLSGERGGMQKVKWLRTVDCVVGGFRYGSREPTVVGSLLLGLYDAEGRLDHIGFCASLRADERRALTGKLERLVKPPGFTGSAPGGPSRWNRGRSGDWQPLDPVLVVEVSYDHFSGGRFRHGTRFLRWRPDKDPRQCTIDQVLRGARAA
jgi:ATP-dependent DNA ligase